MATKDGAELEAPRRRAGHKGRNVLYLEDQLHAHLPELYRLGRLVDQYPCAGFGRVQFEEPLLTSPVVVNPKCRA